MKRWSVNENSWSLAVGASEYEEFVRAYKVVFLVSETRDDSEMFACWSRSLMEFGLPELLTALDDVVGDPSLKQSWRANHLGMLKAAIARRRNERRRAEQEELDRQYQQTSCADCDGIGCVFVPHPQCIVDDVWVHPYASVAMYCGCTRGAMKRQAADSYYANKHKRLSPGSIGEYEMLYPHWKQMVAEREAKRESEQDAQHYAKQADKLSPIDVRAALERIKASVGGEGKSPF